ncbi:RNA deprotection pyrophosphohydrolase [Halalkalibacter krulwichiae]|uniref:Putative 8-oxo-dGTP diphosphatase YtkD n=1 Tax=Halalkalibacter krulwichiae TaxID=199441 RepID=A0A1X9MLN4_9BACI|nr:nucleoside triphosphatase YtkD [Halalkalibacter krulwichiae]ARK31802.1 Putative 8-oxo-dGTP diphosphatase YtkD [Halalkalibacter krulwichiae]
MYQFNDYNNCNVRLTFEENGFTEHPKHVWVICKYEDKWLLTDHSKRGLEFPGGKVEEGETLIEAAKREVWEETGARIKSLHWIGQYEVTCDSSSFHKAIYFAEIVSIEEKLHYLETAGPTLLNSLPANIRKNTSFSFLMKDEVLPYSLQQIAKMQLF